MKRDILIGTLTGLAAVLSTSLFAPGPPKPARPRQLPRFEMPLGDAGQSLLPATQPDEARRQLDTLLDDVSVREARLDWMLRYLAEVTGGNFVVNWRAMEEAGVERGTPVTLDLHHVTAGAVLKATLQKAGEASSTRLAYQVMNGVVHVSTAELLFRQTVLRIYEVRDLYEHGFAQRRIATDAAGNPMQAEIPDSLIALIQKSVEPAEWRDAGGRNGIIVEFGGRLLIDAAPLIHEQVAELLATIRKDGAKQ